MSFPALSPTMAAARIALRRRWPLIGSLTVLTLIGAFGNAWDLYWHIMVGRDSFWIPPHTMMYTAVALSGILAAAVVLADTLTPVRRDEVTTILRFRAPLGYFVLGLGALQMVVSAPLDDWWHRTYGLDVTVWSPPHLVGFSGATVMLSGIIIATFSERQRSLPMSPSRDRWSFLLLVLLFALVVRWVTFLNSTSLELSWVLDDDDFSIAGPWAGWWGMWASFFLGWTFVASARCREGRERWRMPLLIVLAALLLRALEFVIAAAGFALVLPWGTQRLHESFRPFFDYDLGLWVTTAVLVPAAVMISLLTARYRHWSAVRFGLAGGVLFGCMLGLQFIVLRPVFDLVPIGSAVQLQVMAVCLVAGLLGGLIGGIQGDWLGRFRR